MVPFWDHGSIVWFLSYAKSIHPIHGGLVDPKLGASKSFGLRMIRIIEIRLWSDWIYMKDHEIISYSHAWSFKQQIVTHGPQTPCNNPSNHNALGTCSDTFTARFVGEICGSNAKRAFAEFSTRPGPGNDDLGDTAVLRAAASPSHKRWIAKMNKGYWYSKPTDSFRLHCMHGFWWPRLTTNLREKKQHHLRSCFRGS